DFAEAFWGDKHICRNCRRESRANSIGGCNDCGAHEFGNFLKEWQYHLQEMVLRDRPVIYLERFLKENI
ncbi:MAG: hypothetical protein AABY22_06140, partial [Nanoarchaeota archaeon]